MPHCLPDRLTLLLPLFCLAPKAFTTTLLHAWFSRKFAVGCAILFPVAVTVYITW